jgi:hypothetical protein
MCYSAIVSLISKLMISKASVLSQSGGTCVCTDTTDPTCATDVDYNTCLIGMSFRYDVGV